MARRQNRAESVTQLDLDFERLIEQSEVLTRDELAPADAVKETGATYSPVQQTTLYMSRAVALEEGWNTTLRAARQALLSQDPRQLYADFIEDLSSKVNAGVANAPRLAELLQAVAVRGLGMTATELLITKPPSGGTRWRVARNGQAVERFLAANVSGAGFLNELSAERDSRRLVIGSSDVSQHRSSVPVPARYFRRSVPFVLNNAAGALFSTTDTGPHYDNLFNPAPDEKLLRWMLIDPSYQDEMEPHDYERCVASAMDVGQYRFDLDYLLKSDKVTPNVVLRDGSLFPQDAYIDNYIVDSKRAEFTREAIREFHSCLLQAQGLGVVYCGVSKNVQLKVYSAVLDWYISRHIDASWDIGSYTLNDGQAMSLLLSSPEFAADSLASVVTTCFIRRRFTTRANLNTRIAPGQSISSYISEFAARHPEIDLTPYRRLCDVGDLQMFFMGHSKTPQQQLPRYEFRLTPEEGDPGAVGAQILNALRQCGLMNDNDHSFMADQPTTYLLPSVTQQAHLLSKDVGRMIDRQTGQQIMARYRASLDRMV